MKKKYNKSEIMKRAWELFKSLKGAAFSFCLKKSWELAKKTPRKPAEKKEVKHPVRIISIEKWYLRKISSENFMALSSGIEIDDIILEKESEKAIQVSTEWDGYRKFFWIPKSACKYAFS